MERALAVFQKLNRGALQLYNKIESRKRVNQGKVLLLFRIYFPELFGKIRNFRVYSYLAFFTVSWRPIQFLSTSQVNPTNDPADELLGQKPPEKWGQRKEKLLPGLSYHIW